MSAGTMHLNELRLITPHTYKALTYLVPAMEEFELDKKTFWGESRSLELHAKYKEKLFATVLSMVKDEVFAKFSDSDHVLDKLIELIQKFFNAHPNWPVAVECANKNFIFRRRQTTELIDQLLEAYTDTKIARLTYKLNMAESSSQIFKDNYLKVCWLINQFEYEGFLTSDEFHDAMDKHIDQYKRMID